MSVLPPEIWCSICAYSDNPVPLWRSCRPISHALKAGVEVYVSAIFLPKRLRISYVELVNTKERYYDCPCATFFEYSKDHRLAYYKIRPFQFFSRLSRPDHQLCLRIIRRDITYVPNEFKEFSNVDFIRWPNRFDYHRLSRYSAYCEIIVAGSDVYLASRKEAKLSFESDLEKQVIVFDWRETLIRPFSTDLEAAWNRLWRPRDTNFAR
jgi:hypothetical protein